MNLLLPHCIVIGYFPGKNGNYSDISQFRYFIRHRLDQTVRCPPTQPTLAQVTRITAHAAHDPFETDTKLPVAQCA